jgi:hypothetical protein
LRRALYVDDLDFRWARLWRAVSETEAAGEGGLDHQNGSTRALTVAHHGDGLFIPIEIGPHVSASLAADLTDEPRFQVGQPDVIGPSVPADRD